MNRRRLAVLVLVAAGALGAPAAASAAPATPAPASATPASGAAASAPAARPPVAAVGAPAAATDVDDFEFSSLTVDYELGRDDAGHSTLRTTEHFVAEFPAEQNRGIRRAIPASYDGHSTSLDIVSVTDETGAPRDVETEHDEEFLVLTIAVPEGRFVEGEQHYVIEYTQRDVTRSFDDTGADEFYWDVNGTGWAQPFGVVEATVHLAPDLAGAVTATACYVGYEGSSTRCDAPLDADEVRVAATDLAPFQNVTVVVGFPTGTFAGADLFAYVPLPALLGVGAGLAALVFTLVVAYGVWRDAPGRGTVIARYEPPAGVSVFLAAQLLGKKSKGMAATIVDLGVRRKLRIVERDASWGSTEFGLVPLTGRDDPELLAEERRVMTAIFSRRLERVPADAAAAADGHVRWLKKNDTTLARFVQRETKAARTQALRDGLRRRPPTWPAVVVGLLAAAAFGLCLLTAITAATETAIIIGVLGTIAISWIGIAAVSIVASRAPLTSAGAEFVEHLEGLAEFIRWAEADRLRMLQSVTGAERSALDRSGGADGSADGGPGTPGAPDARSVRVIRVYERLLPYAVLFGLEKEWAEELSRYYAEESPDWYAGAHGFAVGSFASGLGSFSSSVSSSYSGSASSSSSGGSSGGGSSGGGGGGGGGGGV